MKTLLYNCDIVASEIKEGEEYTVIRNGFLGIDGKYIDYISQEKPKEEYENKKDMHGAILMPAFVNAHGHAPMTLLRGVGNGLPLDRWLNEAIFPIEAKMTPGDIYAGAQAAMLEMLACGTSCYSEMYDFPYAEAKAAAESGMKCNISRPGLCFEPDFDIKTNVRFRETTEFVKILRGEMSGNEECGREIGEMDDSILKAVKDGRIVPEMCLHSEYLTNEGYARAAADAAKEMKTNINIHVSETKKEHAECIERHGKTPIAYLESCGILDSPTIAAHCVWVSDDDLKIMKKHETSMVHNPSSNLKLGSGIAPVVKALRTGVNVALGTDGTASNNNLNMFEEMHIAGLLASGSSCDASAVQPAQILRMGTAAGARALRRQRCGALSKGCAADIAAVSKDAPHMVPSQDILGLLCYSAQACDVVMTMVDGKILYENGEYKTLDKEKIIFNLEKTVANLFNRV